MMMKRLMFYVWSVVLVALICESNAQDQRNPRVIDSNSRGTINDYVEDTLVNNNELVVSFVVFRHGDRTPDPLELELYPAWKVDDKIFFPHGKKSLTVKGRQRAYALGEYLRRRYNDSISELYLPEEISVRTTDFARTKMTALSVLAALYLPHPIQRWHPDINWQPIPYSTVPYNEDDLLYVINCVRYNQLKSRVYEIPLMRNVIDSYGDLFKLFSAKIGRNITKPQEVFFLDNLFQAMLLYFDYCDGYKQLRSSTYEVPKIRYMIDSYGGLFKLLSDKTGRKITTPEEVFFLDNLFQAMENSGATIPPWVKDVMPQIKNMTKIDYYAQYYNDDLIRLTTGVLMEEIANLTKAAIGGNTEVAKLYLYSGHEHNVAAMLAALRVWIPHQPKYASAVSLELRRNLDTGKYGVMVVYASEAGEPGLVLPIPNCGGELICDYDKFIALTKDIIISRQEYKNLCSIPYTSV